VQRPSYIQETYENKRSGRVLVQSQMARKAHYLCSETALYMGTQKKRNEAAWKEKTNENRITYLVN